MCRWFAPRGRCRYSWVMPSKIDFGGFTITVPTGELAEAIRQLRRLEDPSGKVVPSVGVTQMSPQLDLSSVEMKSHGKRTDKEITLDFLRAIEEFEVSGGGAPQGRI